MFPLCCDYANVGQGFGYREAAINGYSRVLTLDPNNAKALENRWRRLISARVNIFRSGS